MELPSLDAPQLQELVSDTPFQPAFTLLKSSIRMFQVNSRSPSRVIAGHAHAAARALAEGWPAMDWNVDDPPALALAST